MIVYVGTYRCYDTIGMPYSHEKIQKMHDQLGHRLGWRLLTCPEKNLVEAHTALITLNPGGSTFEPPAWSVETGSAYELESWKGKPPGAEKLQQQVRFMLELVGLQPNEILSGYLVPFRSASWKTLEKQSKSLEFGISIWSNIIAHSSAKLILAFGKSVAHHLQGPLDATQIASISASWGNQTIDVYTGRGGQRIITLPHLSRFALFGRDNRASEEAFLRALEKQK